MQPGNDSQGGDELPFGAALAQLEETVNRLESNPELDLAEALALYEQGAGLVQRCRAVLAQAELRLTELPVVTPADDEPSDPAEAGA